MAFLFGRNKQKASLDLVRSTKDLVQKLATDENPPPKLAEELARNLGQMKVALQGTPGEMTTCAEFGLLLYEKGAAASFLTNSFVKTLARTLTELIELEVSPDQVYQLIHMILQEDLLLLLATSIRKLPFEARKDTQAIMSNVFRFKNPGSTSHEPVALHHVIKNRPEIFIALCNGYNDKNSSLPCGAILREALKWDAVAAIILYNEPTAPGVVPDISNIDPTVPSSGEGVFWKFFDYIDKCPFDVSADSFTTFREILTRHKQLVSTYLFHNFDAFFNNYNEVLMLSESYVTKRQSIKLLGEILLDRANYKVMTKYVESGSNLKIIMNLLRDERKMINYEGFHVFKVFVANPHKSVAVQRILINNRAALLKFLPTFLEDRTEDDQFNDEKTFLIRQIDMLPPAPVPPENAMPANGGQ
ncbi:Mo25-like-domain-containing protein [Cryomyces antarcticus]|nr:hypothetical protein LTR04_000019 [Oleoguttula sp. CCFEE 6159]